MRRPGRVRAVDLGADVAPGAPVCDERPRVRRHEVRGRRRGCRRWGQDREDATCDRVGQAESSAMDLHDARLALLADAEFAPGSQTERSQVVRVPAIERPVAELTALPNRKLRERDRNRARRGGAGPGAVRQRRLGCNVGWRQRPLRFNAPGTCSRGHAPVSGDPRIHVDRRLVRKCPPPTSRSSIAGCVWSVKQMSAQVAVELRECWQVILALALTRLGRSLARGRTR